MMIKRRVLLKFGFIDETARKWLVHIPGRIGETIPEEGDIRYVRWHCVRYGNASIDVTTVSFVWSPDYARYMDLQMAVWLTIHEPYQKAIVNVSVPAQTLCLTRTPAGASP